MIHSFVFLVKSVISLTSEAQGLPKKSTKASESCLVIFFGWIFACPSLSVPFSVQLFWGQQKMKLRSQNGREKRDCDRFESNTQSKSHQLLPQIATTVKPQMLDLAEASSNHRTFSFGDTTIIPWTSAINRHEKPTSRRMRSVKANCDWNVATWLPCRLAESRDYKHRGIKVEHTS